MKKLMGVELSTAKTFQLFVAFFLLSLTAGTVTTSAQTLTILHSFTGSGSDGIAPFAALVQCRDGNFFGTTANGIVFRIGPSGNYTSLYSFAASNDGFGPHAGLTRGSDDNLYGTTTMSGIVFRISPNGSYTNLYSFVGHPNDGGGIPTAGLIRGIDGNLFGTTYNGGTSNLGTIFRISPNGDYTNLYSFIGLPSDGANPLYAGLVQGIDDNLYGTTRHGGMHNIGTIFRISPNGCYTNLHSFGGPPGDGSDPEAGLVQGSDGSFYGTTAAGGTTDHGTVFRFNPNGMYTSLYSFVSSPSDGVIPIAELVQGSDGNLYGTTTGGGTNGLAGTVFRISHGGSETNLHNFVGYPTDGFQPVAGLVQGSDGSFYGTTFSGGASTNCSGTGCGTVFKLVVPLNPSANEISALQVSGSDLIVSVPSVAQETYQLQFSASMNPPNWLNVPGLSVTNSVGALLTLTNFGGALQAQGFYRFDITP